MYSDGQCLIALHTTAQLIYDSDAASFMFLSLKPDKISSEERKQFKESGIKITPLMSEILYFVNYNHFSLYIIGIAIIETSSTRVSLTLSRYHSTAMAVSLSLMRTSM